MKLMKCVLLAMLLTVPVLTWAQNDALSGKDSIVSMRELHRLHREEKIARGPLGRRDMGNGKTTMLSLRSNLL